MIEVLCDNCVQASADFEGQDVAADLDVEDEGGGAQVLPDIFEAAVDEQEGSLLPKASSLDFREDVATPQVQTLHTAQDTSPLLECEAESCASPPVCWTNLGHVCAE